MSLASILCWKEDFGQDWVHGCLPGLISLSAPVALRPPPELIRPMCECTLGYIGWKVSVFAKYEKDALSWTS